jgi:hypothetical protein
MGDITVTRLESGDIKITRHKEGMANFLTISYYESLEVYSQLLTLLKEEGVISKHLSE